MKEREREKLFIILNEKKNEISLKEILYFCVVAILQNRKVKKEKNP